MVIAEQGSKDRNVIDRRRGEVEALDLDPTEPVVERLSEREGAIAPP
jgi:hypothetical protein